MATTVPRVSEILSSAGLGVEIPGLTDERREWILARGRALHAAIELDAVGDLDDASVHPEIAGGLDAYRKWVAETKHVPLVIDGRPCSELELVHPQWQYMGHPDRIGYVNGRLALVDWKRSVDTWAVRHQLAGYAMLWRAAYPKHTIQDYLAIQLNADGRASVHPIDPRPHEQTFLAALVVYRARQARQEIRP